MNDTSIGMTPEELRVAILAERDKIARWQGNQHKEQIRELHAASVLQHLKLSQAWVRRTWPKRKHYFADGSDVEPKQISPILVEVAERWHYDLFRLARLTWSLPFTRGYGRRLRFLVMDGATEKLIGILGLQSPPLDFPARDAMMSYPEGKKIQMVNQTMDIYTLGAVPPYSRLLGGKLVAYAAVSDEVRSAYRSKYSGRVTLMTKEKLPPELVALSTTSAFGRSSLYNRLTYRDSMNGEVRTIAEPLGYTKGYGSFHLSAVYDSVKDYLETRGISSSGGFGVGPRIVWQNHVRAWKALGLSGKAMRHGVKRQIFWFPLARNVIDYMSGRDCAPEYYRQSFDELAGWWCERWLLPRSERVDGWHRWDHSEIGNIVQVNDSG